MTTRLPILIAAFALLLALAFSVQQVSSAPPAPNLAVVASADESPSGLSVTLTIEILNSGGADSGQVELTVVLPDLAWHLKDEFGYGDCSIDEDNVLTGAGFVAAWGLQEDLVTFGPGRATCTVNAPVTPCGSYSAFAIVFESDTGEYIESNIASWSRSCSTPTAIPTATPVITATSTPAPPTATPTQQPPTSTPFVVTATPTNTPFRLAPLPPNTGSGDTIESIAANGGRSSTALIGILALTVAALILATTGIVRRRR